ncbi:MAG TPA: YHS domain-containing protein [Bryobacteraceae bacterium]|nr:YHS domain-containing protein [Bryobacteraceae bacterium]
MEQDPICGQLVDEALALSSKYEDRTYYFCSEDCKAEFEDDPERYTSWGGNALSGSA